MTAPLVVLERLSYQYPRSETLALRDISLEIQRGEFVGLIGPTGAGKTTLCLALNGIVPQFYGGVSLGVLLWQGWTRSSNLFMRLRRGWAWFSKTPRRS